MSKIQNRHCTPDEVVSIRNHLRKRAISDATLSRALGLSRTQLNQMLNERQPMRRVYRWAILGYLAVKARNDSLG